MTIKELFKMGFDDAANCLCNDEDDIITKGHLKNILQSAIIKDKDLKLCEFILRHLIYDNAEYFIYKYFEDEGIGTYFIKPIRDIEDLFEFCEDYENYTNEISKKSILQ